MKILLYFIPFILWCYFSECEQPNFPPQIVFSPGNGQTIIAIDEINQRAYQSIHVYPSKTQASFAMKNFPYSVPDSLQSKYYVELVIDPLMNTYAYETYLKYGGNNFNVFPSHWLLNGNEDYLYANVNSEIEGGSNYPYQEIYLKENTEISLQLTQVVYRGFRFIRITTNYKIISIGKSDEKYFDLIPKNLSITCQDLDLGLLYYLQFSKRSLHQSVEIHISLSTPSH